MPYVPVCRPARPYACARATPDRPMAKLRGLYVLDTDAYEMIFGPDERRDIERHVDIVAPPQTRQSLAARPELLRDVEVLFSGWGAPLADEAPLDRAPKLEAVFYAAGAVGYWMTEAVWRRGIVVTSAYAANAIPVAEYTLSTILFSLKHGWQLTRATQTKRTFPRRDDAPGCYDSTVGLI